MKEIAIIAVSGWLAGGLIVVAEHFAYRPNLEEAARQRREHPIAFWIAVAIFMLVAMVVWPAAAFKTIRGWWQS